MDGTLYMLLYLVVMRVKKRRLSSYMRQHMPVCQRPLRGPVRTKLSAATKSLERLIGGDMDGDTRGESPQSSDAMWSSHTRSASTCRIMSVLIDTSEIFNRCSDIIAIS